MLAFKIEDKVFEAKFLNYVKKHKGSIEDVALDAGRDQTLTIEIKGLFV